MKLATIFLDHTDNAFFAKILVQDLLREFSKNPNVIIEQLRTCLLEIQKLEEKEKNQEAKIALEQLDRERELQRRRWREGLWWDERDEFEYRPNA